MNFRKTALFTFFASFFAFSLYAQQQLSPLNTSWSQVLSGTVNAEPALTSYGFCIQTDARTVSSVTSSGTLLWEKSFSRSKDTSIFSLSEDFILFYEKAATRIKMINPSGKIIWEKTLEEKMILPPKSGLDGRFFIFTSAKIICFTKNGSVRWTYDCVADSSINIQEFSDGTILVFTGTEKGKSKGIHFSPFGDALEEITFAGKVVSAESFEDGILLIFDDGSAGLMNLDSSSRAENKWVLDSKNKTRRFCVSQDKKEVLLIQENRGKTEVFTLDKNGKVLTEFDTNDIILKNIRHLNFSSEGIFLCDDKNAFLFSKNGAVKWEAKMPKKESGINGINYTSLFFLNDGYLVFCDKNWSVKAFRVFQKKYTPQNDNRSYKTFMNISYAAYDIVYTGSFEKEIINPKIAEELFSSAQKDGLKPGREVKISSDVYSATEAYYKSLTTSDFGTRKEKTVFETDSKGFENILRQLCLLGTKDSAQTTAKIIEKTSNRTYISILLEGISSNGYDPEQVILDSLLILSKKTDYKATSIINQICDAVYEICFFMGKPAYNSKGKEILKNFMYPNYKSQTRDYARKTLQKIADLDM